MKNKSTVLILVAVILLGVTSAVVYKLFAKSSPVAPKPQQEAVEPTIAPADSKLQVTVTKSASKDNSVVINISPLASGYATIAYELTYDSDGLIKGVNSGSKPVDVSGKDSLSREIYLGTCSRNVCRPDPHVTKISLALEFVDTNGQKTQFAKDFDL